MSVSEEQKLEQFFRQFRFRAPGPLAMPERTSTVSPTGGKSSVPVHRSWNIDDTRGPQAVVTIGADHREPMASPQTFERTEYMPLAIAIPVFVVVPWARLSSFCSTSARRVLEYCASGCPRARETGRMRPSRI